MSTSRRSFLAGSIGAVALGVAACASDAPKKTGTTATGSGTGTGAGTTTPPKDISGSLLIWDFGTEGLAKLDDAAFKALYPNVTVKHIDQPAANYATLLQTALAAGKGPDAFTLHAGTETGQFSPTLLDLTDRITPDQKKYMTDYSGMSPGGDASKGIFGLPYQLNGLQFFYNKKLFTQAGLDPETPPASWPDLLNACEKLKAANITPISAGDAENIQAAEWFGVLAPMALTVEEGAALSAGTLKYNSPKVKDCFQKYLDLAKGGNFEKSWRSDGFFTQQVDIFSSGKAAITMTLSNYVGVFHDAIKDDLGVFQNPGLTEGSKSNYLPYAPGAALCVSKRSKNPDAAFAWASFKTSMANQESDLAALSTADKLQNGALPTDTRVKPAADALPQVKAMVTALQTNPTHLPPASQKPAVGTAMIQGFGSVVDGRKSLDSFLDSLDKAQAG